VSSLFFLDLLELLLDDDFPDFFFFLLLELLDDLLLAELFLDFGFSSV